MTESTVRSPFLDKIFVMKRIPEILCLLLMISLQTYGQGEITGKITDEFGEPIDAAFVALEGSGIQQMTYSDVDGSYSLKPLDPGSYNLSFSRTGYKAQHFSNVKVGVDQILFLDVKLVLKESTIVIDVIEYKDPLITIGVPPPAFVTRGDQLEKAASRIIADAISFAPSVVQEDTGGPIYVRGARAGSTVYYVDGMRMSDTRGVPISAVDQLSVLTGAIPAKYGDCTGGVVILTTKSY